MSHTIFSGTRTFCPNLETPFPQLHEVLGYVPLTTFPHKLFLLHDTAWQSEFEEHT